MITGLSHVFKLGSVNIEYIWIILDSEFGTQALGALVHYLDSFKLSVTTIPTLLT